MSEQIATQPVFRPHPLVTLRPGDVVWTWCSRHLERTRHVYRPGTPHPLTCLECHPEDDPEKEQQR